MARPNPKANENSEAKSAADIKGTRAPDQCVSDVGPYRIIRLCNSIDPATELRRCVLFRRLTNVLDVEDYHTDIDIVSHLGTHVEAPYHHGDLTKDVTDIPFSQYVGRGVVLSLDTCAARALVTRQDLEIADRGRLQRGDIALLDSQFHSEPFAQVADDLRPHIGKEAAEWFLEKKVKAVGFGDGISIENNVDECNAFHDILLGNDILIIEVLRNLDRLIEDTCLIAFMPLPIRGLDSSPVHAIAIEGIPGF